MVRYATLDDINWLKELYAENADMIALQPATEQFALDIENNRIYLYCDDNTEVPMVAMVISDEGDYFDVNFISTKLEYRGHGYAEILAAVVYARMNKPARFVVEKEGTFHDWVFSNPEFAANATKLEECQSFYGKVFERYTVNYPYPHE